MLTFIGLMKDYEFLFFTLLNLTFGQNLKVAIVRVTSQWFKNQRESFSNTGLEKPSVICTVKYKLKANIQDFTKKP